MRAGATAPCLYTAGGDVMCLCLCVSGDGGSVHAPVCVLVPPPRVSIQLAAMLCVCVCMCQATVDLFTRLYACWCHRPVSLYSWRRCYVSVSVCVRRRWICSRACMRAGATAPCLYTAGGDVMCLCLCVSGDGGSVHAPVCVLVPPPRVSIQLAAMLCVCVCVSGDGGSVHAPVCVLVPPPRVSIQLAAMLCVCVCVCQATVDLFTRLYACWCHRPVSLYSWRRCYVSVSVCVRRRWICSRACMRAGATAPCLYTAGGDVMCLCLCVRRRWICSRACMRAGATAPCLYTAGGDVMCLCLCVSGDGGSVHAPVCVLVPPPRVSIQLAAMLCVCVCVCQATVDLFTRLYACWCHSPVSLLALCLLTHNYRHCNHLIATLYPF
ncbi:unnamed protein product [Diatraea saccharalis]|uniref:Vacuolar protein 14 C-terminal Fig4-binding domain-containing protein n=1 Tax=Diatraea saccharalis TaxID=40085 RepID=A0A9N9RD94_9NEOP|nr:unnamed protein product [Diatraea saccharalis]